MPISNPELRYATYSEEADGVKTDFEVSFIGGYISAAHIKCYSVVVDATTGLETDRTDHTTEVISTDGSSATVRVSPAVASGRTVVIFRDTAKSAMLVDYVNKSVLTRGNLNLSNTQLLMLVQEILDNIATNSVSVNDAVGTVTDLNVLIQQIYEEVLLLLASGGIVSVTPRVWSGEGNGEDTDFVIAGADVDGAGFYDTYLDGVGLEPDVDYSIIPGETPTTTAIRFTVAPPLGLKWFTVLRGYARPYTGPAPVTSLRVPQIEVLGTSYIAGFESEFAMLNCMAATATTVEVKEIPVAGDTNSKMYTGSYFSVIQRGSGQVTLIPETLEVTLIIPAGAQAKTRAEGSVITATCLNGEVGLWAISGDLAATE